MRTLASLLVAAAVAAGGITTEATGRSASASLRLVSMQPLTVRGLGFKSRERVRVEVTGKVTARRRVVASKAGRFTTRFAEVYVTRCDMIRVVATGSGGSRAVLKFLPAPACNPV